MRKTFLILLMTITIFITLNGLVYAKEGDVPNTLQKAGFPYTLRETSDGIYIELPLVSFREIVINANTSRLQLLELQDRYNKDMADSVPKEDYNNLSRLLTKEAQFADNMTKQRNMYRNGLIGTGLILVGVVVTGLVR